MKRKRGRPPGSKNKQEKETSDESDVNHTLFMIGCISAQILMLLAEIAVRPTKMRTKLLKNLKNTSNISNGTH